EGGQRGEDSAGRYSGQESPVWLTQTWNRVYKPGALFWGYQTPCRSRSGRTAESNPTGLIISFSLFICLVPPHEVSITCTAIIGGE
ncbi:MAG: hypothetical protein ACK53Y_01505, partial [bacterium]